MDRPLRGTTEALETAAEQRLVTFSHRSRKTMLVVMSHNATSSEIDGVVEMIREMGYEAAPIPGRQRTAVGLVGNDGNVDSSRLEALPGVMQVIHVTQPYKQVSREWREEPTVVELPNGTRIGDREVAVMAGPCSVESRDQILGIARRLRDAGATILRGGAFKPRSSPYSFQGLGVAGLELLAEAREETGMAIVTEAVDPEGVDIVAEYADIVQIGARNMQNFSLLRRAGRAGKPVLLKRGMAATVKDLLLSAEYVLAEGNPHVILCERGVRGFDTHTRNLLDLTAIPVVKSLSHLPIIADPSHGTGLRAKVIPMGRAAVAAGADGLMIEVHPDPEHALSDGAQSLFPEQFEELMVQIGVIARAIGRDLTPPLMPAGATAPAVPRIA
jgi:3-deoxy-7-phosphoheptulonate synthase